jgi:hypothetical protein
MEVSGQLHAPAALPSGKEPLLPTEYEAGWAPQPVWTRWWRQKFPTPSGSRTPNHPARSPELNEGVSKNFRTDRLKQELQMVQLSGTSCSCIAILWVSLVSFAAITPCVASQRVFTVVSEYFVIGSDQKLLDTPSYYWAIPAPYLLRRAG